MEKERTRLVEEGNTIYEIDLDCMRKKERERERAQKKQRERQAGDPRRY